VTAKTQTGVVLAENYLYFVDAGIIIMPYWFYHWGWYCSADPASHPVAPHSIG